MTLSSDDLELLITNKGILPIKRHTNDTTELEVKIATWPLW
jgi:hypothetical protein